MIIQLRCAIAAVASALVCYALVPLSYKIDTQYQHHSGGGTMFIPIFIPAFVALCVEFSLPALRWSAATRITLGMPLSRYMLLAGSLVMDLSFGEMFIPHRSLSDAVNTFAIAALSSGILFALSSITNERTKVSSTIVFCFIPTLVLSSVLFLGVLGHFHGGRSIILLLCGVTFSIGFLLLRKLAGDQVSVGAPTVLGSAKKLYGMQRIGLITGALMIASNTIFHFHSMLALPLAVAAAFLLTSVIDRRSARIAMNAKAMPVEVNTIVQRTRPR